MAISFPAPVLPAVVPATTSAPVAAAAAAAPVALLAAEDGALPLPLPYSEPLADGAASAPEAGQEGPAMRPDQVVLARQLAYPALRGDVLAANWQSMLRTYGNMAARRELQERAGHLPPALLAAAQDGRVLRQQDAHANPLDAWRFTVHAGGAHAHTLRVVGDEQDRPRQHKRRMRGALRLELVLDDGSTVVVQAEPLPGGLAVELYASGGAPAARLHALQPSLELALERAGLRILRWSVRDTLPAGNLHARSSLDDAARVLSLPVFRAVAELALLLPAAGRTES